jgi:hypothetical protein
MTAITIFLVTVVLLIVGMLLYGGITTENT